MSYSVTRNVIYVSMVNYVVQNINKMERTVLMEMHILTVQLVITVITTMETIQSELIRFDVRLELIMTRLAKQAEMIVFHVIPDHSVMELSHGRRRSKTVLAVLFAKLEHLLNIHSTLLLTNFVLLLMIFER